MNTAGVQVLVRSVGRMICLSVGQMSIDPLKRREGETTVAAETQVQPPASRDQPGGQVHQLLDDGFEPSTFGRVPHGRFVAEQPELADEAQDVVGERGAGHDQAVDLEAFRGEPLQVHVGLELAVKLLTGAVVLVEGDDLLGGQLQGGPPAFQPRTV